jgi:uncharacterized membrane protein
MKIAPSLVRPLLGAALIVGLSAALVWLTPATISPELSQRLLGALLGAVVVVYANAIPKAIASLTSKTRRSAAEEQAARRFAGWAMVVGGLAYMLAWLAAPIALARPIGGGLLAVALLLAVLRCLKTGRNNRSTGT